MGTPNVYLKGDGIVRIDYRDFDRITIDVVNDAYEQHRDLSEEKTPVLIFGQSVLAMDHEAAGFVSGDKVKGVTKAAAILTKTWLEKNLGDFYLSFRRPPFPVRLFVTETEALDWLKEYVH
jgi:hypothetical protein